MEATEWPMEGSAVRYTFDIDRFMDASGPLDLSGIDWARVPEHRLTPEALRTVRYFMRTESATFYYLRSAIGTRAATEEPEMAPFLCAWAYEEEFHGRAFKRFVEAYGEPVDAGYRAAMFQGRGFGEKVDEWLATAVSKAFPDAWPAVHMVWGASAEYTTYQAYKQLIARTDHPILHTLCERIVKQELKHFAFYYQQAHRRLAESAVARRLVSALLRSAWTPVGDGMSPKSEVFHAMRFLFDGADGEVIPQIEDKIRSLPGLEWFDLFSQLVARHGLRRAPAAWLAAPLAAAEPGEVTASRISTVTKGGLATTC